ncbi:MAG: ABC transporter permease [Chloroflexi bacterium]|nr:ABC transporter permease [Chloroflexota bacterium]
MKKWFGTLATVWLGLSTHKLRSFLTMLGIIIGVASVISLMSIGRGTQATIMSRLESLGSNLFFIQPGAIVQGGVRSEAGTARLTMEDAQAIAEEANGVVAVAPFYSTNLQVIAGGQNSRSRVTGITPEYQMVFNLEAADGTLISDYEYERAVREAVIGPTVKQTLFGDDEAIGQSIRLGSFTATVVGVLKSKGASMLGSTDEAILIPLTTLQQSVAQPRTSSGERVVSSIVVSGDGEMNSNSIVDSITSVLRERHKLALGVDNDFMVTSQEDLANTISQAAGSMTMLLAAIAAISLLVGGIGVMNIMLVSVLERTREIGIRKALGAREQDIWSQFLLEAAFLTFTGGIIGVIIGWIISLVIPGMLQITTTVSADIVVLAVSVSVGIGLFFGFYPAWNASRLDPIQALRSE